jgi:hypothetical protein
MVVRFRPTGPADDRADDRAAVLGPTPTYDVVVRCRFCRLEWRMPAAVVEAAEKSLRRHYARKHPKNRQPSKLTTGDLRVTAALEPQYLKAARGSTKRSRENRLRVTDGRVHPVTVRPIDEEAR